MPDSLSETSLAAPPVMTDDTDVLDVSVVIVNYNVREFLEQALRSVARAAVGLRAEVIVVDNNSVDRSTDMVRSCFPTVRLIANERNVGFSAANNQAIGQARGRYLLILNPDTLVQEDTLTTLVRFLDEHPEAGAVGCTILNPDGTFALESRRAFPTPRVAFYRMTGLSRLFPRSRRFGRYNLTYLPVDAVAEVDALSGSCMMVRHAALYRQAGRAPSPSIPASVPEGAGLLDEAFFMYGEDLDWCFRIQQAGWKIYYTPATQIIHYKGESTKKGDLRYVRLFYGAMLRFAEKHFKGRYSGLFIGLLRLGVFTRASLSVAANTLRRLAQPVLEFSVMAVVVALLGLWRSMQTDVPFSSLFYGLVVPAYALTMVLGIALLGGYRRGRRERLRPVWLGAGCGLLLASATSFFIKDIAFSRIVVLAAFSFGALLLTGLRLWRRTRNTTPRRALLVGESAEAYRLAAMLAGRPRAPFELIGYVTAGDAAPTNGKMEGPLHLGAFRHLRDLVRLRAIDDVIFAASGLPNRVIFGLIDELRDLPVQFRILAEGREHVIGKASIDDLSAPPLIEAEEALGLHRTPAARRSFEVGVALLGLAMYPIVAFAAAASGAEARSRRLKNKLDALPAVLRGRQALIGFDPTANWTPPPEWGLRPGLVAVTDAVETLSPQEANRAYGFYVRNQSASLDWSILARAVRRL